MSALDASGLDALPRIARLAGHAMALGYRLLGKHRYDDYRLERVRGVPLLVLPSVFNPKVPRTGAFLATHLDSLAVSPEHTVLDMGTGSGVCAVFAARQARRVLAVDLNPAAVECARINVLINRLEHRVEVRVGDLFEPAAGERFDLVLFNPPFLRGTPQDQRDRAWRSSDIAERFAAGLEAHLKVDGRAVLVLSTFGHGRRFIDALGEHGWSARALAARRYVNERLMLFEFRRAAAGAA